MQAGGTLGQRFGAQKKLGILIGGTYDYNGRGINDIEPSPTTGASGYAGYSATPHYDSMDHPRLRYDRTRWGSAGSVDYKLGEGSGLYLRGLFSTFRNWGNKWTFTLNDVGQAEVQPGSGAVRTWRSATWWLAASTFSTFMVCLGCLGGPLAPLGGNGGNGGAKYKWTRLCHRKC